MHHPDPGNVRIYIESDRERKPVPFPVTVLPFHLDHGQDGPVFLNGDILQFALVVVEVEDSGTFLADIFSNAHQPSFPCDFFASHLDGFDQLGAFPGETDSFHAVLDNDLVVPLAYPYIPGLRRRGRFLALVLPGQRLHADFQPLGIPGSYRTRQAQPFHGTILVSGHHPLLQRQRLPRSVGQDGLLPVLDLTDGEWNAPTLAHGRFRGFSNPLQFYFLRFNGDGQEYR